MKKILLPLSFFFATQLFAQTYTVPGAQIQPAWVFPVWFEDFNGEKDTVFFCYDPEADNNDYGYGHDTIYGEKVIKIDTSRFNAYLYQDNLFVLKAQVWQGLAVPFG